MFASLDRQRILRNQLGLFPALGALLDPVVIVGTLAANAWYYGQPFGAQYVILALIVASLSFPGSLHIQDSLGKMLRKVLFSWAAIAFILLFFGWASGYVAAFPQDLLVGWVGTVPIAQIIAHEIVRVSTPKVMTAMGQQRLAVVAGVNDLGLQLAQHMKENPYLGMRLVGFFDDRRGDRLGKLGEHAFLGPFSNLASYVKQHNIDLIYLNLPMASQPRILQLLDDLRDTTASIYFVPDIFLTDLIQARMDDVGGIPVVSVCETPFTGVNGLVKRTSDIVLSILILVLISPVLLAVAMGVKLSSPGPIIFKQRRYGLDGREIMVYKFRSMVSQDNGSVVKQATRDDPRITPFGRFIRKTSLDELPQFVNVLQGRMSIVGPRPHAVAHNELYRKLIKGYMIRHKVKPGITGWAQVNGFRGETETVDKMKGRIDFDLAYLRHWSLGLDLKIIFRTVRMTVAGDKQAY